LGAVPAVPVGCEQPVEAAFASLCPNAIAFGEELPTVTLAAEHAKNGKTAVQPLPPDVVLALREYLAGQPDDAPVWHGTWPKKAAEMIGLDLEAAGISFVADGPDGPLYADFHPRTALAERIVCMNPVKRPSNSEFGSR
jgi:hypothetical protein